MNNKTLIGLLCGLGAASIWGGMYVVSKVVLEIIPPFALVSIRLILGALTLAIVLIGRGFPSISRRQFLQVLGVGFVGYGISLSLQFLGTKLSTAANGSLVTSATPAFVLVFAWNEYLLALFLSNANAQTLPLTVAAQNATRGPQWWYMSVLILIMIVPVVAMVVALERYIRGGMLIGAVKG